jgi:hypothetical protein
MSKARFFFKWTFVFTVLGAWTFFVIQSLALGSANSLFEEEFNVPIYVETNAGIERASSALIIDFLFNYDFDVEDRVEVIPMDYCSMRARGGELIIGGDSKTENSDLSFNINHLSRGSGELTAQDGKERFSLKFTPEDITETNIDILEFFGSGSGLLNRQPVVFENVEVLFDKETSKVSVFGSGDFEFELNDAEATFIEGCFAKLDGFYLLVDQGKLGNRRSIEEVRMLLNEHPELMDAYEGLRRLFREYWWLAIPSGMAIIS